MGGGKGRICAVCGVRERHRNGFFANFPLDENRCKEWVRLCGDEDLVFLPIEKLSQLRHICGDHFDKKDFNRKGNRLKKTAIPKLKLLAAPLTDDKLQGFPFHVASKTDASANALPSTSQQGLTSTPRQNLNDAAVNVMPVLPSTSQQGLTSTVERNLNETTPKKTRCDEVLRRAESPTEQKAKNRRHLHDNIETTPKKTRLDEALPRAESPTERKAKKRRHLHDNIDFSPRKKKLVLELQETKCTLASLKRSAKLVEKISSPVLKDLVAADLNNQKKKPRGRRWTLKEKISALAIFKRSPKTYRYLAHGVMLPSVKTLHNLLRKIPMETGINSAVLQHLKRVSSTMKETNKFCALLFDEIALKPRLIFNEVTDEVDGFEDKGKISGRTDQIADHALVFMLQGLHARYKQIIAYYFVKGTVSSQQLSVYIKNCIKAVNDTGFKVIVTVCDQGPTNMGGLKNLRKNSKTRSGEAIESHADNFFIDDEGNKIFIMYDIPHLFKSIRNNFMNHGQIQFDKKLGRWSHLQEAEHKNSTLLHLSKITAAHVRPKYRQKMKVKYAAQALSKTVSAVLKLMSEAERDKIRSKDILETGQIIEELDYLFDVTNGPSSKKDIKKGRRENVSAKTNHPDVWKEFKKKISCLKFIKNDGTTATNVKCVQGMLISLNTLEDIWKYLHSQGFRFLNLRSLNQDGLENFFGVIRQHCPTNRNPTCTGFTAALKASVVSGMTAPHSKGNCENDNRKLLTNFFDVLGTFCDEAVTEDSNKENVQPTTSAVSAVPFDDEYENALFSIPEESESRHEINFAEIEYQPLVYVCGYLASSLKKLNCETCKKLLIEVDEIKQQSEVYKYIQLREWFTKKHSLTYPTIALCKLVETAVGVFEADVIPRLNERNITELCKVLFIAHCDMSWYTCSHAILDRIFGRLSHLLIRRQCHRINQRLAESEEKIKDICKKAEQMGHTTVK